MSQGSFFSPFCFSTIFSLFFALCILPVGIFLLVYRRSEVGGDDEYSGVRVIHEGMLMLAKQPEPIAWRGLLPGEGYLLNAGVYATNVF